MKLPEKSKNPGSFAIPCLMEDQQFKRALCDLGASINLMSLSMFKQIGVGILKPTPIKLQMADRNVVHPEGVLDNVLMKFGNLIFPVDFIVMDKAEDEEIPIILGRPFLAAARMLVDIDKGKLTLCLEDKHVSFYFFISFFTNEIKKCCAVNVVLSKSQKNNAIKAQVLEGCVPQTLIVTLRRVWITTSRAR